MQIYMLRGFLIELSFGIFLSFVLLRHTKSEKKYSKKFEASSEIARPQNIIIHCWTRMGGHGIVTYQLEKLNVNQQNCHCISLRLWCVKKAVTLHLYIHIQVKKHGEIVFCSDPCSAGDLCPLWLCPPFAHGDKLLDLSDYY